MVVPVVVVMPLIVVTAGCLFIVTRDELPLHQRMYAMHIAQSQYGVFRPARYAWRRRVSCAVQPSGGTTAAQPSAAAAP